MRTLLTAVALGLALLARPHSGVAQDTYGDGKNVFAFSMGYNRAPIDGFAMTASYGRDLSFFRGVIAVDGIGTGEAAGDSYWDTNLNTCRSMDGGELTDASDCVGDMEFAGRGELLVRLPLGLSFGPGVRFKRDFAPYGAAQLEVKVGPAAKYLLFGHGTFGEEIRQFDLGFGMRL